MHTSPLAAVLFVSLWRTFNYSHNDIIHFNKIICQVINPDGQQYGCRAQQAIVTETPPRCWFPTDLKPSHQTTQTVSVANKSNPTWVLLRDSETKVRAVLTECSRGGLVNLFVSYKASQNTAV